MIHNIKNKMQQQGVTSAWLAKETGLSKVAISNILTGKSSPSIENMIKIANALKTDINSLVYGDSPITTPMILCPHCGKELSIKIEG